MSNLTLGALVFVAVVLALILSRLTLRLGVRPLTERDMSRTVAAPESAALDVSYQETLNLADVQLNQTETVLAACGRRGEVEQVILATNQRLFFFSRRYGASRYHAEIFSYAHMRPVPLGQAVIGEKIRLMEGERIAEMNSPGHESWMDSAEKTISVINRLIRAARTGA